MLNEVKHLARMSARLCSLISRRKESREKLALQQA
jgi:hypothetical protein